MSISTAWQDWSCTVRVTLAPTGADAVAPRDLTWAAERVREVMARVGDAADRFRPESDLSLINERAGTLVPVRPLTINLVELALEAAAATGGLVDPTVGSHVIAAGYDTDIDQVRARRHNVAAQPAAGEVLPHWSAVRIDPLLDRIGVPAGLRLDLGATAKAWAADEAARIIEQRSGWAVLVEIGGDLAAAGWPAVPWRIEVAEVAGGEGEVVGFTAGGLATSSTVARRWATTEGSAHHLIDPRTGTPVDGPWRTATVWAPTSLAANTASTALLVAGDDAVALAAERGWAARLVDRVGRVRTTDGWPRTEVAA